MKDMCPECGKYTMEMDVSFCEVPGDEVWFDGTGKCPCGTEIKFNRESSRDYMKKCDDREAANKKTVKTQD